MDAEQTIAEIERLERIFAVPGTRPLSASDLAAANRRHDDKLAHSPWFRLWQRYGVCRVQVNNIYWVVERTFAWLNQFRRRCACGRKNGQIFTGAFLSLGCALICWRFLRVDLAAVES